MANKPTKPVHQAKVFTPEQIQEQKKNQALAMLVQKREAFAINILCQMTHECGYEISHGNTKDLVESFVDTAVKMADRLLEKLYPVKEEKQ